MVRLSTGLNVGTGHAFNSCEDQYMDLQPIRRYAEPAYPTRHMLLADPGILQRHLPPSWQRLAGVGGILAFFLQAEVLAGEAATPAPPVGGAAIIAPIFRHGEGRGSFGCVAVSPPVFLSEEEALVVIGEELGRKGVALSQRATVWTDTPVAPRTVERVFTKKEGEKDKPPVEDTANAKSLVVDAVDPGKGIAVEYIAQANYETLGGVDPYRGSTVSSFDFIDAAGYLARKAAVHHEAGKRWMGVFYDPMGRAPEAQRAEMPAGLDEKAKEAWWKQDWEQRTAAARKVAVEQLRLQVRDFVAWLEAQGAL